MDEQLREGVFRVIRFVASPLRFFAVAIAALLAACCILAWKSTLPATTTAGVIYFLLAAVGALLILVTYLIVAHPKKLVFDQEAHLTYLRERLGDNTFTETYTAGSIPAQQPPKQLAGEVRQ